MGFGPGGFFTPGAGGGGGGNPADGTAFMKWNGIDTAQFSGAADFASANISASSLTVVADVPSPGENLLRLSITTTDALDAVLVWLIDTVPAWELEATNRENRSFILDLDAQNDGGGSFVGMAFLCDLGGGFHGYGWTYSAAGSDIVRIDAGAPTFGASGGTSNNASSSRYVAYAGKRAGSAPSWATSFTRADGINTFGDRETQAIVGGIPPASWDGLACDRVGLCITQSILGTRDYDYRGISYNLIRQA